MKLDREQRKVAGTIVKRGRKRKESRREIIAALETGLVESSLRNLSGGHGSSVGWRQETASSYPNVNRRNVKGAVDRFYDETSRVEGKYGKAGNLAQAVQRSAFPGRYNDRKREALSIYRDLKGGKSTGRSPSGDSKVTSTVTPGVDRSPERKALLAQFLTNRPSSSQDPLKQLQSSASRTGSLVALHGQLKQVQDTPATETRKRVSVRQPKKVRRRSRSDHEVMKVRNVADKIDKAKVPYLWGGGHARKIGRHEKVTPLDCSGAVSRALGIDPRVSGQFTKWGKPGKGRVTVYADAGHVLMSVDGRFWGTSRSNPGGGAGWLPKGAVSPAYLSRFTARHMG